MEVDITQVLSRQYLLDIANQLASENRHFESAQAYEKFLKHYDNYEYIEQVQLMLGILYSRYLDRFQLAKKYLEAEVFFVLIMAGNYIFSVQIKKLAITVSSANLKP